MAAAVAGRPGVIAIRLVGGNNSAKPAPGHSPRDPFGTRVTLTMGDQRIVRENTSCNGFATQDSARLLIGIGSHRQADEVEVRWPSGEVSRTGAIPSGTLVTIYEVPEPAPGDPTHRSEPYLKPAVDHGPLLVAADHQEDRLPVPAASGRLVVTTTMATWCLACREHLPRIARLRSLEPEVGWLGLPVDASEPQSLIERWRQTHRPPYRLLAEPSPALRQRALAAIEQALGPGVLPASIVTTADGRILAVRPGLPSLSEMRRLRRESVGRQK